MPLFHRRFTHKMEQEARKYLPTTNDCTMKKIFEDSRLWPGVLSHLEFTSMITVAGIRDGLFTDDYKMKKTLTKIGSRRGSGVRYLGLQSISEK